MTDSSGSTVRNADIDIVSTTTKETQAVHTNDDGYFQFPSVTPGSYVLHAQASSFAPYTMNDLKLEVGTPRSLEIVLAPAKAVQQVQVTATAPELVTDTPNRGNVIESQFVQNTPLNVRNPLQLVNFAQGVTAYSTDSGNNDSSQAYTNTFRINGGSWPPQKACWTVARTPQVMTTTRLRPFRPWTPSRNSRC